MYLIKPHKNKKVQNINPHPHQEPIPYFSPLQSIRLWLLHPELSRIIVDINNQRTLPYIDFIVENSQNDRLPPGFLTDKISHMSSGSEWLEPFRRTIRYWLPAYRQNLKVIFLHILFFGDGIQLWKRNQKGYEVITSTLGEFSEGQIIFPFNFISCFLIIYSF